MWWLSILHEKAFRRLIIGLLVLLAAPPVTGGNAADSRDTSYRKMIHNIQWILVTVENLDPGTEDPRRLLKAIRDDIKTKMAPYLARIRFAEQAEQIPAASYLWVRVRKIVLERTVYLSSVELVVDQKASPQIETAELETPPRYTRVSNQLKTVRQKIEYLMNDIIHDYLR
ncbi:MAG: hypothetical protein ACOZF0_03185 [Thermodesulfobacteriota bacterium]